jgi:hypothetical protein
MGGVMVGHLRAEERDELRPWRQLLGGVVRQTVEDALRGCQEACAWLAELGVEPAELAPHLTRQGGYGARQRPVTQAYERWRAGQATVTVPAIVAAIGCSRIMARQLIIDDLQTGRLRQVRGRGHQHVFAVEAHDGGDH